MIDIEVLNPDDWRLWRRLRREALSESAAAFGSTLAQWSGHGDIEQRWRARLSDVPLNLALRLNGAPAGMVSCDVQSDEVAELISMWVAPFARGRGLGDAAIRAVTNWAVPRDVTLSVKAANLRAIALYRRHGFTGVGPSPDGPDELLMVRHHGRLGDRT